MMRRPHGERTNRAVLIAGVFVVGLFLSTLAPVATAQTQPPPARTIVFDAPDQNGRFQIFLKNLDLNNAPLGPAVQVTSAGAGQQAAQEPQFSLVASANATVPDFLGRIVYQFGAPGVRGLHLIKPDGTGDVQLTPPPGGNYPCVDARDPAWSPDGLHIVYACLEPLASGIGSSYDLWIHDTNGTPDNPADDADYPLLILNGPLALQPAWSPNGRMIAYVTNAPGTTNVPGNNATGPTPKIGLITVPPIRGSILYGGNILTNDAFNDIAPSWDPSSHLIAFSTTRSANSGGTLTSGSNRTVWTMTAAGQIVAQLTGTSSSTANDNHPTWSTGNVIAFQSDRSNGNNVWIINANTPESLGGIPQQITGGSGDPGNPTFSSGLRGVDFAPQCAFQVTRRPASCSNDPNTWGDLTDSELQLMAQDNIEVVVVKAYGGVHPDSGNCLLLAPQGCAEKTLLAAQAHEMYTGAYIELTFANSIPNYGAQAVQDAISAIGSAWANLDFVALVVERDGTPVGTAAQHVTEIKDAISAVKNAGGNPVIYTWYSEWKFMTCDQPPTPTCDGAVDPLFRAVPLWEAGGQDAGDKLADLGGGTDVPFPDPGGWQTRLGKQYDCGPGCNGITKYGVDLDLDIFDANIFGTSLGNTPAGSGVVVAAANGAIGTALTDVTFANVIQAGLTTVTSTGSGPAIPAGLQLGSPPTYYDVTTTALFTGLVQVCLDYTGISFGSQNLVLFHYENGQWVNRTASVDTVNHIICASVTSLSPFVILQPASQLAPTVAVTGGAFVYNGVAHGANATATGVSGAPVAGSFTFTYTPGGSSPPVNVGTYSVTSQFTSTDPNYTNASNTGTITITPAPTQTQTTTPTGSMRFARVSHQATLLADGLVLVSGGQNGGTAIPESELYNPATGTWSLTGSNIIARFDHTATILLDGRVLAAGGVSSTGDCSSNVTSETYDPTTGQWTSTSRLPSPVGTGHNAIRLLDGRVLVSGGGDRCGNVFNTAAVFNPSTNKWSVAHNMTAAREFHSAALLPDGRVLVAGGVATSPFPAVASAEIYDPTTNVWTPVASMGTARQTSCKGYTEPYLANLSGGTVLAAGGFSGPNCSAITPQRTVTGLTVNPSPVQLSGAGHAQALSVTAQMSDGSTQTFTGSLQFTSADTTVTTVDSDGLVTAVGAGTTTITVTTTGVAPVTVTTSVASRQLISISVSPVSITLIGTGLTQPLAVNGQYSDGSQQALTTGVTFTSSNSAVASVDATGLVTSGANGTATITVSAQGAPAVQIPVTVKSLVSIAASPTSISFNAIGQAQTISVTGLFTDGSRQILTGTASFLSSDPTVARVDLSGNVTAVNFGTATITLAVPNLTAVQVTVNVVQAPVLLSVNPSNGQQGQQNLAVTVTGQFTHWVQGTTVAAFGPGITVVSLTVNSATSATAVLNISASAPLGSGAVTVTTGSEIVTLSSAFTATPGPPALLAVTPSRAEIGLQGLSVTLNGQLTHWVQGTTTATFGAGITVATLRVSSATSATAVLNIDPAAAIGPRTVTITTGSEVVSLALGFTVTPPSALSQLSPYSGGQGQQSLNVAVAGQNTNWVQGATTTSFGAGIAVVSLTVNSPTSANAVLNIDPAATIGPRTVTLTTGAEVETLINAFVVTGSLNEVDATPFSVLNTSGAGGTGGRQASEIDAAPFSVLNTSGTGGTGGGQSSEVDATDFSVLNMAGITGGKPVPMEADAAPFSVLNTAGPGGSGSSQTFFEVDGLLFSGLNLAGMSGNQPVKMEVDGVPFSVQNGPPVAQAVPSNVVPAKQAQQTKTTPKNVGTSGRAEQDSGGTNTSSSTERDKQ